MSDLTAAPAENPALPTKEVSAGMSHEVLPNVSEQVIEAAPEVSQVASKASSTTGSSTFTPAKKSSKAVVKKLPTESVQRKELTKVVQRRLSYLEHQARTIKRSLVKFSADKLENIVRRINQLRQLLLDIPNLVGESLENFYRTYVRA